jgi:glutamyl-tRNA reductase
VTRIVDSEVAKTLQQSLSHLSRDEVAALHRMRDAMVNKILHDPTLFLKRSGCYGDKDRYLDMTRKLFRLDEE